MPGAELPSNKDERRATPSSELPDTINKVIKLNSRETNQMMKFREFLKQRRRKTTKDAEQSGHQSLEPHNQVRVDDTRVVIGIDGSDLPPAVIPPTIGNDG